MAPKKEPQQDGQQVKALAPQLEDEKTVFSHCDLQYGSHPRNLLLTLLLDYANNLTMTEASWSPANTQISA